MFGFAPTQGAPHGAQALPSSVGAPKLDKAGLLRWSLIATANSTARSVIYINRGLIFGVVCRVFMALKSKFCPQAYTQNTASKGQRKPDPAMQTAGSGASQKRPDITSETKPRANTHQHTAKRRGL